ncbi:MAG: VCBS repeat-containing protein, partial [Bacteroidota bacterium]
DLYFTGNLVSNRLYLNKGDFRFEDITDRAGVDGMGRWGRGVAVIDINNDGWADIYVCNTIYKDSLRRRNLLYINKGPDKDGIPHFVEAAAEYGLDIHVQSTMASFFDYDNDGDLDMYLTVNEASADNNPNKFGMAVRPGGPRSTGRLYRNDWDSLLQHPVYRDVSAQAGIRLDGFGHAATIADINLDGWKDIYVSDDFLSNNILYINNHDGTFTDRAAEYFKHTSYNAMGQDIVDINNDGLADVVELDMNPEDNYRKKMMLSASNYLTFQNFDAYGTQYQYVRNTLQLNQGPRLGENDSVGSPVFSEIGFMSGIAQTDWSWTPVVADFNNDGFRDIVVTNGFPKDVSDHDFISYQQQSKGLVSKKQILEKIPAVKLHNYAFANNGSLRFGDVTTAWGLDEPTFSNGAVYADLNNDGALDMIVNNINDEALIYRNTVRERDSATSHYLQVRCIGAAMNRNGLGAWVAIYYNGGQHQVWENNPYRGYLSTHQGFAHFGLGSIVMLDSVVIRWPEGKQQVLTSVNANQLLTVNIRNAREPYIWRQPVADSAALFREVTRSKGIRYQHNDVDFIDFDIQKLLPHKLSGYAPALAAGDIDGNGYDDLIVGGASYHHAQLLLQQKNGQFIQRDLLPEGTRAGGKPGAGADNMVRYNDEGLLLFDADGDGDLDLYIASGGYKNPPGSPAYQDRLYINDGKGNFTLASDALPDNHTSKFCVRAADFNHDGKLDLFVSDRVDPWSYPKPVSCYLFRNDSQKGHIRFTDVTDELAPGLKNIGMVCDALFTDMDNDGQPDLVLAGEWMPVTFLRNVNGQFKNVTAGTGIGDKTGWWNSIVAGDFRHTGRMDYIVGNVGLNTIYQANDQYPVYITAKDFDHNSSYNPILSYFIPDEKGQKKEFPQAGRDDVIKQIVSIKKRYPTYAPFARATLEEILTPEQRAGALRLKANMLQSCYLRNEGEGKFTVIPLPVQAQVSVLNGMVVDDFDGDGNPDVLINGNDYGTEVSTGRYDALNGLLLKGDGAGGFLPLTILQSGIYIPGDGKALVRLGSSTGDYLVAASQHQNALKLFGEKRAVRMVKIEPDEVSAMIHFKNGKI